MNSDFAWMYEPKHKARKLTLTLNDDDRAQWIDNDEGLYAWWRSSRQSKRAFIRENRDELSRLILAKLNRSPIS